MTVKIIKNKILQPLKQYYGCPYKDNNCPYYENHHEGHICFNENKQEECLLKYITEEEE